LKTPDEEKTVLKSDEFADCRGSVLELFFIKSVTAALIIPVNKKTNVFYNLSPRDLR